MLTIRQKRLLADIVENYTETSEPVGSTLLAGKKRWQVSSATLRNEMSVLEKKGLITHPHTSAGRLPTPAGYRYYINNYLIPKHLNERTARRLIDAYSRPDSTEQKIKSLAKELAELAGQAIVVAFSKNSVYYTGLSHLLIQPEFSEQSELHELVGALDNCEMTFADIMDRVSEKPKIFIGDNNDFIEFCSFIVVRFMYEGGKSIIGLLGPIRMDYNKNYSLIAYSQSLLN